MRLADIGHAMRPLDHPLFGGRVVEGGTLGGPGVASRPELKIDAAMTEAPRSVQAGSRSSRAPWSAYAPSKSMLNSLTAQYARRLADTPVIVNACCPGYVASDFTGFNGLRTPEQGAAIAVHPATVPDDGPRGGFFDDEGVVPW